MATKARGSKSKPKLGSGVRFKKLTKSLKARGARDPSALAAHIGRRKYGKTQMSKMAATGRKRAARKKSRSTG